MPAFNIECTHKYLVVMGIEKFEKTNSFKEACSIAKGYDDNSCIYEHVGSDWYALADVINNHITPCILVIYQ